jgi:hypothetical protein
MHFNRINLFNFHETQKLKDYDHTVKSTINYLASLFLFDSHHFDSNCSLIHQTLRNFFENSHPTS